MTHISPDGSMRKERLKASVFQQHHLKPTMSLEEFADMELQDALQRKQRQTEAEAGQSHLSQNYLLLKYILKLMRSHIYLYNFFFFWGLLVFFGGLVCRSESSGSEDEAVGRDGKGRRFGVGEQSDCS